MRGNLQRELDQEVTEFERATTQPAQQQVIAAWDWGFDTSDIVFFDEQGKLHQRVTRQRTEAADATASSATVDTEASAHTEAEQGQTNNRHTTNTRETTTTTTTKETKDNSNIH